MGRETDRGREIERDKVKERRRDSKGNGERRRETGIESDTESER